MDIARAVTFLLDDERRLEKVGMGVAVAAVSILLSAAGIGLLGYMILMGYSIRLVQNVRDGETRPLPEWDQWGEDLVRGLKLFVALLVWSLPLMVIGVPLVAGGILVDSGSATMEVLGGIILACTGCLSVVYGLFLALSLPGITIAFAQTEAIGPALRVTPILRWTRVNLGEVILVALVALAGSLSISVVGLVAGIVLCVIGLLVTLPLAQLVTMLFQHHLYGQIARKAPLELRASSAP